MGDSNMFFTKFSFVHTHRIAFGCPSTLFLSLSISHCLFASVYHGKPNFEESSVFYRLVL